jgi:hypothetical protein
MTQRKGTGRQCTYVYEDGHQCGSWATRASFEDGGEPFCWFHSMTPEERSENARRAAKANAAKRLIRIEPLPQAELRVGVTLGELMEVVRPALTATLPTGEPDWCARLAAVAVTLLAAPRQLRDSPEKVKELLARSLPDDIGVDPERVSAEAAYKAMRREFWSIPRHSKLRGLFARDLPRAFVLPWEDYATVVRNEMPKEYKGEVMHLPNGQVAWKREAEIPLLVEDEEDNGGIMRVPSHAR